MAGISQVEAAVLGKLGEEAAELANIIFRIWIQGINECDPESGKENRAALMEEIADVEAMLEMAKRHFGILYRASISVRREKKIAMKTEWVRMIEEYYENRVYGPGGVRPSGTPS